MSSGRGAWTRLAPVLIVLGLFLVPAPARAQDKVGVDAGIHDGFARIVFNWPAKIAYETRLDGRTLTVHFARPLNADLPVIARRIDDHVESVVMKGDSDVVITLRRTVGLKSYLDGDKVVLDLLDQPADAPRSDATKPGAPKGETAGGAPVAPELVPVKVEETNGARRLVFEWPKRTEYTVAIDKGEAQIHFKTAAPIDAARLAAEAPELAPRATASGKDLTVALTLPPGARLRHTRNGRYVILDVQPGRTQGNVRAPLALVKAPETVKQPASLKPGQAPPVNLAAPAAQPSPPSAAAAAAVAEPALAEADSGQLPESVTLRFDWHKPIGLAVFRREAALWIVFSAVVPVDLAKLKAEGGTVLHSLDQVPHASATILRLTAADGVNPSIRRADTEWVVELHQQPMQPEAPIKVSIQASAKPPRVLFTMNDPGEPVAFRDPEIGDTLIVVPAPQIGQGVAGGERLVDFTALPTAQGVALRLDSDAVVVRSASDGVEVTSKTGIVLSTEADRTPHRSDLRSHLFEFSEWYGPRNLDFLAQRRALEHAIVVAPQMSRWSARLDLAHFYFAHLFAPEALGVIEAIKRDDPSYADDPRVRALSGATRLLGRDFEGAVREFGRPEFDDEPEVALWRGSLAYARRDWQAAGDDFARGAAFLRNYPKPLRNRFALEAAEADLASGRHDDALEYINLVLKNKPTAPDRAAANLLSARELQAAGESVKARALLDKVAAGSDRPTRARALMTRTLDDLEAGKITRPKAIEALDGLRFAWRGDDFELNLMRRLGELKIKDGDYRGGFDALRQAVDNFPDYPEHPAIKQELTDAFADIFIGPDAENVAPLKALALYDEFKELTPSGSKGDEIIRKLADRLVAIDLLDRAADLLDNQVRQRLKGRDKARVATRLALVRLLDRKPQEALTALDIDVGPDVDPDLQRQRQQLRARALVELGRTGEALATLGDDNSRDADRLRADVAWRTKNWPEAAKIFERLAAAPDSSGKLDDDAAKTILNWGTTLTLAGDQIGITALAQRYAKAMDSTPYRDAFRVIAGSATGAQGDVRALASKVAQISDLQSFMAGYRQRLANEKLSAIN